MRKVLSPLLLIGALCLSQGVGAQLKNDKVSLVKMVHQEKSMYRNILILEGAGVRCMTFGIGHSVQSCIPTSGSPHMVFGYTRALLAALYLNPKPQRVLVLGMGGGIIPMALRKVSPGLQIDTVELDPAVILMAKRFFNFKPDESNQAFSEDGRMFVRKKIRSGASYDLIVLDAFERDHVPEHLLTKEFMTQLKTLLTPDGILAVNTIKHPVFSVYESATYQAVFGDLLSVDVIGNRILLAGRAPFPADAQILANAKALDDVLAQFSVKSREVIAAMARVSKVTDPSVKILTDQFAPSNLLLRAEN